MYITPHMLNVMLLARDMNGRRIYASKAELASAFNVGRFITAEQFEGKTRKTDDSKTKKLLAIITNLNDYSGRYEGRRSHPLYAVRYRL